MRIAALPILALLILSPVSGAQEPVALEGLLALTDHEDPFVRREAEISLVERGFRAMAAVTKAGAETARRALVLAHRLAGAPRDSAAFRCVTWMTSPPACRARGTSAAA